MLSIALFHFHVTQIKRSAGQSAVASAAYRAGEKLHLANGDVLTVQILPPTVPGKSCTASITVRTVTTPEKAA